MTRSGKTGEGVGFESSPTDVGRGLKTPPSTKGGWLASVDQEGFESTHSRKAGSMISSKGSISSMVERRLLTSLVPVQLRHGALGK